MLATGGLRGLDDVCVWRGLVGAVQDWACGSEENVITLLVRLISHFKLRDAAEPTASSTPRLSSS